jgi:hypothetical protein
MSDIMLRGILGTSAIEPALETLSDPFDIGCSPHQIIEVEDVAEEVPVTNGGVDL